MMEEEIEEIEEISKQINSLKEKKKKIIESQKYKKNDKKKIENKTLPNILRRMSTKFFFKMEFIDKKREEFGLDLLSLPEKTELIVRHKNWMNIQEDLINFNKNLVNNGGIINVQ